MPEVQQAPHHAVCGRSEDRELDIGLNDLLRTEMKGGRIEVRHGPYDIEDRIIGRMLCVLARYNRFEPDSLHDEGLFIFAGFAFSWKIEIENGERVLTVWVQRDALQGAV
jgi:hypothetical protein